MIDSINKPPHVVCCCSLCMTSLLYVIVCCIYDVALLYVVDVSVCCMLSVCWQINKVFSPLRSFGSVHPFIYLSAHTHSQTCLSVTAGLFINNLLQLYHGLSRHVLCVFSLHCPLASSRPFLFNNFLPFVAISPARVWAPSFFSVFFPLFSFRSCFFRFLSSFIHSFLLFFMTTVLWG